MSCLVPMKKPKNCYEYGGCPLFDRQYRVCKVAKVDYYDFDKQYANCPLIELPPHGRLIDADKLKSRLVLDEDASELKKISADILKWIDIQETVIEAEGET